MRNLTLLTLLFSFLSPFHAVADTNQETLKSKWSNWAKTATFKKPVTDSKRKDLLLKNATELRGLIFIYEKTKNWSNTKNHTSYGAGLIEHIEHIRVSKLLGCKGMNGLGHGIGCTRLTGELHKKGHYNSYVWRSY